MSLRLAHPGHAPLKGKVRLADARSALSGPAWGRVQSSCVCVEFILCWGPGPQTERPSWTICEEVLKPVPTLLTAPRPLCWASGGRETGSGGQGGNSRSPGYVPVLLNLAHLSIAAKIPLARFERLVTTINSVLQAPDTVSPMPL